MESNSFDLFRREYLISGMQRYLLYSILVLILAGGIYFLVTNKKNYSSDEKTLAQGNNLFTQYCKSCHALEAEGFGPPLGGITNLLTKKALVDFISNPYKVITSGNERAASQHARYKQTMPAFEWMKEAEINAILSYIHQQTSLHHLEVATINSVNADSGLSGKLVPPVIKSDLKIELEDVIQIPRIIDSFPDLGIVTLRAHPSGNGILFASDQNGVIYRIHNGKENIFLDMRKLVKDFQHGPGIATGIGSFDFHPDFLNNGLLYITHSETYKGQPADYSVTDSVHQSEVEWVLAEWKMNNVKDTVFSGTHRELLRTHAPTFAHGCQEIAFIPGLKKTDPDYGLLYIGYGDGGSNNIKRPELGHSLKSFLGTIFRIDPAGHNSRNGHYGIPASNPFVNEKDPSTVNEIYAYGFRNPHHFAWDPANKNRMIVTDIGEANIEEINMVVNGGDYGWPVREGNYGITTTKNLKRVYPLTKADLDLYKKPFAQYDHTTGNAISGGYVYEGGIAALKNKFVFGDIVNGKLFYVNMDPQLSDSTVYELTIMQNGKETTLQEMSKEKRMHLRLGYDQFTKQLYVITKVDGTIRRVTKAY